MSETSQGVQRIGVIGAGRVGSVLAAALRSAGHEIVSIAGESDASTQRAAALLPGVPMRKPTAVARSCDVLLLTVPDDMLSNVVSMLAGAGALRAGQVVAHTSGRHGVSVLAPAHALGAITISMHPAMTFTGTDLDLPRLAGCAFAVTTGSVQALAHAEQLVADLGGNLVTVPESMRAVYHAGLAHGANHLVTLVTQAMGLLRASGAIDPATTLRPLLTAALENALVMEDAALTGPIVRGDVETVRAHVDGIIANQPDTLSSYVALARVSANAAVLDGRLLPIRAAKLIGVLNDALARTVTQRQTGPGARGPVASGG